MKTAVMSINPSGDKNFTYSKNIAKYLSQNNVKVLCDIEGIENTEYEKDYAKMFEKADFGITLGGDGTLLRIAQYSAKTNVPILGINLGRLGFLVELEKDEFSGIDKILKGEYEIENRMMIEANVIRDGQEILNLIALNDIVVAKGNMAKMIHFKLEIDNALVNDYHADGVIFATPTGSTAYSMSAGGPVLHPSLDAITITPVCPHTMTSRPVVTGINQDITLTTEIAHDEKIVLYADGNEKINLYGNDIVKITKSPYSVGLIRTENRSFFEILNKKLSERK